jgi:hypothetical protein
LPDKIVIIHICDVSLSNKSAILATDSGNSGYLLPKLGNILIATLMNYG